MHIALIIPPSEFLADERVFPSLGILRIAAVLRREGHAVDVIDLSGIENYEEAVREYTTHYQPDWFGVTVTTPQVSTAWKICRILRTNPHNRIILGGPHVTTTYTSFKLSKQQSIYHRNRTHGAFQQLLEMGTNLVAGDGERAVLDVIHNNTSIIDADDRNSPFFLKRGTLEQYPFPDRSLIDLKSYHYLIENEKTTSVISQLGCPFACSFCSARLSPSFRTIRIRPPSHVVQEVKHLYDEYSYCGFFFLDDELNVNTSFMSLLHLLIQLQEEIGIDFRLRGFLKAELFTEEQAQLMYEAGFRNILIGFESGSSRILENINKKATRDDNTRAMEIATKYNLKVKALMSLGHPGETQETARDTLDWLLSVKPHDFDLTVITVYPSTPYYDLSEYLERDVWTFTAKSGDKLYFADTNFVNDNTYYKGIPGNYRSHVWTDSLTQKDIVNIRDNIEKEVRSALHIPFYQVQSRSRIETSMGQGLPLSVLRRSA